MNPEVTAAIIAACVSVLTLIGTVAAQYVGRRVTSRDTQQSFEEQRRQLDRTLAEQRTRTLNERFATAAEQLGSDKPAVRLAGVYAMAGLADDWDENRQTCVDVLCAYLRMPYELDPGKDASEQQRLAFQAVREVRHTVIRVVNAHLKEDAAVSWQGLDLDFTGVVFDGGDFRSVIFSGGTADFSGARFSGGTVDFSGARFSGGTVDFRGARFSGGLVDFSRGRFTGGTVNFSNARFSGGQVTFNNVRFGGGKVNFCTAQFSGSTVYLGFAEFCGAIAEFTDASISSGTVSFIGAQFSGGTVYFGGARFSGGLVDFSGARFSGGAVDFSRGGFFGISVVAKSARFSGGTVDFSGAGNWAFPPTFPWTDIPPSGVRLPKKADHSQA